MLGLVAGLATSDHDMPFHCSRMPTVAAPLLDAPPTAKQFVLLEHATSASTLLSAVGSEPLGLESLVHMLPSKRLISVEPVVASEPTATHDIALVHATASSDRPEPDSDVVTSDHDMPSHCSMSGSATAGSSVVSVADPTAAQKLAPVHATPVSTLSLPGTFGLATSNHAVP